MAYPMGGFDHTTFVLDSYRRLLIISLEGTSQIHLLMTA